MSQSQSQQKVGLTQCTNVVFHGLDILVGLLVFIDSIVLLSRVASFVGFVIPVYFLVFGALILLFVFYAPPRLYVAVIFYFNFCGRGLTFLFIGSVLLTFGDDFSVATGVIAVMVAFVYLVFSIWTRFCRLGCSLPPPFIQRKDGVPPPSSSSNSKNRNTNKQTNSKQPTSAPSPVPQQQQEMQPPPQQQQYGNAYDDDNDVAVPQYQQTKETNVVEMGHGGDLNELILHSFGKDVTNIATQPVQGYKAEIPVVLVRLEHALAESGGYNKRGIFDAESIEMYKADDEAYKIANNFIAFFSELPSPLLSFVDGQVFDMGVSKDAMWRVMENLPDEQGAVTQFMWDVLAKVAIFETDTCMSSEQLARVFGPLMTMRKQDMSSDQLRASKMIACWRRGIEWRMDAHNV